jgi:hypothetical protein
MVVHFSAKKWLLVRSQSIINSASNFLSFAILKTKYVVSYIGYFENYDIQKLPKASFPYLSNSLAQ